jgi:predicted transcriptional regulator
MHDLLTGIGLTDLQAATYLYLLEHGETAPPSLAKALKMTRTNAYKVLESLEELQLVSRHRRDKKTAYLAADPTALAALLAAKRNNLIALEHHVREAMQELRHVYQRSNPSVVTTGQGQTAMVQAYEQQAALGEPVYFIKSRADIPFLGYDTMDRLRHLPANQGVERYGLTPDSQEAVLNPTIDKRTHLHRTWLASDSYTAPVEWTVSGDELLLQVFSGSGRIIKIQDAEVAEAFRQLWRLTDTALRNDPGYKNLPQHARRTV